MKILDLLLNLNYQALNEANKLGVPKIELAATIEHIE